MMTWKHLLTQNQGNPFRNLLQGRDQDLDPDRDTGRYEDKFKSKSEIFEDEDERFVRYREGSKNDSGVYNDNRYSDHRPDNRSFDSFSDNPKTMKDSVPRDGGGGGGRDR